MYWTSKKKKERRERKLIINVYAYKWSIQIAKYINLWFYKKYANEFELFAIFYEIIKSVHPSLT